ncbi:Response regulatory domain-containing protein [Sphingomonas antarctica]|uniref:response regulator n=1 Tax=Sphingomonas antarctica TaxID=2040274 RepID=UPI0039EA89CC
MPDDTNISLPEGVGVSLVNGDSTVRHARQLLLRSERYDVRSYASCAALLADPASRDNPCIILDLEMQECDGVDILAKMRASGWRGKALLFGSLDPGSVLLYEAERHGDRVMQPNVGDLTLLIAIDASVDRSWAGWNAVA